MDSPQPVAIDVRHVHQIFGSGKGQTCALKDVSFSVDHGEFLSIIGPSGCGKTTLIKLIAGLVSRTEGEIRVNGRIVTSPPTDTALVFQKPALVPWRTLRRNVLLAIEVSKLDVRRHEHLVDELLKLTRIQDFADHYPSEVSLGMQQRASLCRALVTNPRLLLMDEPFASLDEITRERLNLELLEVWESTRKTIVFVTHSIAEAVFSSDRVIVMTGRPGRIREVVPVGFSRPRGPELLATQPFVETCDRVRRSLHDGFS